MAVLPPLTRTPPRSRLSEGARQDEPTSPHKELGEGAVANPSPCLRAATADNDVADSYDSSPLLVPIGHRRP